MKKRIHVYYSGEVQGVGFRFTAEHIAGALGIMGWVKNLADGRVEIVAEGPEAKLDEFLGKIKDGMGHYIRSADVSRFEASGEFKAFEIVF